MKKIILLLACGGFLISCGAGKNVSAISEVPILSTIDLNAVEEDRVKVEINPGAFKASEIRFYIPTTVPGTYSIDNYGQYISNFSALDYKGNAMNFTHPDDNTWVITDAERLDRIRYEVNDTYDTESNESNTVFSPAGTNIEAGENFVLNLHGFVGYFEGYKERPYSLTISAPEDLIPVGSLKTIETEKMGSYTFLAERYFEVIDNPIQFTAQKAASFDLNNIRVNLSVHSPNGTYSSEDLSASMEEMMRAQKAFLGDIDGTEEYNILLYLSAMEADDPFGFGALEHHTSTVVVLPEQLPKPQMEQSMIDVVSHEFFHIVTPLNVHSEEIHFFDYNHPKMSRHLWMYEGTTEYFANLFQIQQGLIEEQEFYERMVQKISNSMGYDDAMSFTEMSENILESPYEDNYANVYEKGALINMCLDILLREWSGGETGVLFLMKQLIEKYDVNTPFKDEELIPEIVAMTAPEIGKFFKTHVEGSTPINYNDFFEKVGLNLGESETSSGFFLMGQVPYVDVKPDNQDVVFIRKGIRLNSFMEDIGLAGGDILKTINGTPIDLNGIRTVIGQSFGWNPDMDIVIEVEREGETIKLEGKAGSPTVLQKGIRPIENPTEKQLKLREAWMKG